MKFDAAERYCKSLGAHLVEFHTKAQYDFLMKYGKKARAYWYWIGLKQKQGAWYWIHSKTKLNSFFQKKVRVYQMVYPYGTYGSWACRSGDEQHFPICQKTFG